MRKPLAIALVAAAALAASACTHERTEDAGPMGAKDFAVGNFTRLTVAGPYEVTVRTGGQPSVSAKGPQNVLDRMVVEVDGDELEIRPEKKNGWSGVRWRGSDKVTLEITVPMINEATIAGSGGVRIDKLSGNKFEGTVAGSGDLDLGAVDVGELEVSLAGSGSLRAAGKARTAEYSIAGSGDIEAAGLTSEMLRVSIAGAGSVRANATKAGSVTIMGSGDVTVTGGAKCDVKKMGSGDVNCS